MADTCEVLGETSTADTGGGYTTTPTVTATVACGVHAVAGGAEQVVADRLDWSVAYAIRFPLGTTVTPVNRLRISNREFEIGAIMQGGANATALVAICQEISNP